MKITILMLFLTSTIISFQTLAASRTVELEVQNMTCPVCPITVKKALERISGVQDVKVDYASKTATVQFDDTIATEDKLTKATKEAGYPSSVKGANK